MMITPSRFLGLAVALAIGLASFSARADDAIGQVKTAKGEVMVLRHGSLQPLVTGDHVLQSDTIRTGKGASSVGITFTDNSMMALGPNSELTLDKFEFDTTTRAGVFNTALAKGTLAVQSGQIVQQTPGAMHIHIPAAVLGVRGTKFVVNVGENS
jgi:hypothetical protein